MKENFFIRINKNENHSLLQDNAKHELEGPVIWEFASCLVSIYAHFDFYICFGFDWFCIRKKIKIRYFLFYILSSLIIHVT